MQPIINFVNGYVLPASAVLLVVWAVLAPVTAWGAEPKYMTVSVCAADPISPDKKQCQEGLLPKSYPDRVLCERAVDLDGDGQPDQVWLDLVPRLLEPGQWLEIQCPPYVIP